jgi:hypothetical protein
MKRSIAIAAVAAVAWILASCGSSGDSSSDRTGRTGDSADGSPTITAEARAANDESTAEISSVDAETAVGVAYVMMLEATHRAREVDLPGITIQDDGTIVFDDLYFYRLVGEAGVDPLASVDIRYTSMSGTVAPNAAGNLVFDVTLVGGAVHTLEFEIASDFYGGEPDEIPIAAQVNGREIELLLIEARMPGYGG